MENKSQGKSHSGSAFLWGFILGAIFASLLTTKKGRAILREIVNTGMEMIEDFIADRKDKAYEKSVAKREAVLAEEENENVVDAMEDLESGTGAVEKEVETVPVEVKPQAEEEEMVIDEVSEEALKMASKMEEKPTKLGSKRRLFKGIRKTKAN